jgi:hypothetical protein
MRLRYGVKPPKAKRDSGSGGAGRNKEASRGADSRDIGSYLGPARPLPLHLRELAEWADKPESWSASHRS